MIIARTTGVLTSFVLPSDSKSERGTTFMLQTLTARQEDEIVELAMVDGKLQNMSIGRAGRAVLLAGLAGWSNFFDAAGAAVPFLPIGSAENLDRLDIFTRQVLANAILELGVVKASTGN